MILRIIINPLTQNLMNLDKLEEATRNYQKSMRRHFNHIICTVNLQNRTKKYT
jgi:hypothetical protein